MPALDMPLEELKKYKGNSPCPSDFDEFWDKSLDEMKALGTDYKLEKSEFQTDYADCFDLTFIGMGGSKIYCKMLRPKNITKPQPAILQFHGYSGSSAEWVSKLALVAAGYTVVAMDCRGQGGKSEDLSQTTGNTLNGHIIRGLDDDPKDFVFRNMFLDTAQIANIVMSMKEVDETRVGVMGGSQGGALTLVCAALEPRINRLAPYYPFLSDYKRVWEMDLAKNAYRELAEYFRRFDPLHKREDEIFNKLGYIDIQNLAKRIKGKLLFTATLMDGTCPPSTQFAVFNKVESEKELIVYPDYGHENLPGCEDRMFQFMIEMKR